MLSGAKAPGKLPSAYTVTVKPNSSTDLLLIRSTTTGSRGNCATRAVSLASGEKQFPS